MNAFKIGIMQGRLTPMKGRGIQFFPFDNWQREFYLAQEIGLDEIEFIFDYEDFQQNPLWKENGIEEIKEVILKTGVLVKAICFDYFMRRPFYKGSKAEKPILCKENEEMLRQIIKAAASIGAKLIEIPLVDNSSVKTKEEKHEVIAFIQKSACFAQEHHITLGLETDFEPGAFKDFLDEIARKNVVANYDSGNSSGLGYSHKKELLSLGEYVYNVHIKDRIFKGTTVALGTGSADFEEVFSSLKQINYQGSIILQAARGEENKEVENIVRQKAFVLNYINKYGL